MNGHPLTLNEDGRWVVDDWVLTSGSGVEICIDGTWLSGVIESSGGKYYWFSRKDSIQVALRIGIRARLPGR